MLFFTMFFSVQFHYGYGRLMVDISHRIHGAGIYANIGGILMVYCYHI